MWNRMRYVNVLRCVDEVIGFGLSVNKPKKRLHSDRQLVICINTNVKALFSDGAWCVSKALRLRCVERMDPEAWFAQENIAGAWEFGEELSGSYSDSGIRACPCAG